MAYVITDACTRDFLCVTECATSAIAPGPDDPASATATQVYINPDECIECGSCMDLCAHAAIFPGDQLPAGKEQFADQNRAYFS